MKWLLPLLTASFFLVFLPMTAFGQSPSTGVPLPDGSVTTQSDPSSLEVNPAGLNFMEGPAMSFGFFWPSQDYALVVPTGYSLAAGVGGRAGALGAGVQFMDNPLLGADRRRFQKYSLGGALGSRIFSLGATWNSFSSREDLRLNDLRTMDLGLQWRPLSYLGFGVMARDLRPAFLDEDEALPLQIAAGMALRFFDGRLIVDNEAQFVSGASHFIYQPRLSAEVLNGVRFFGNGLVAIPMPHRASSGRVDFEGFTLGAALTLGPTRVEGAHYQRSTASSDGLSAIGQSYRVWSGVPAKRSLYTPRERWVRISIDESIAETASAPLFGPPRGAFLATINDLDAIARDGTIKGVILDIGVSSLGYGQLWELHKAMERLHEAEKESVAILRFPTNRGIYAASAAQKIWLSPTTPYAPTGLLAEFTSFSGLFENIGVEAEFIRVGEYKSAPESLTQREPSDEAREQTNRYLDQIYDSLVGIIATNRGLDHDVVRQIFDTTPLLPHEALERGLVDGVYYPDELEALLRTEYSILFDRDYSRREYSEDRWGSRPEIALVYIDGSIIDGESGTSPFGSTGITGAETIRRTLRALQQDSSVKAVVVRIDSPGGSAIGSDLIYRELRNLAAHKPVIASMGNVAASGGYYVAAGADEIFATPNTLTGSIGVFTGKLNVETLAARIGLATTANQRGERAGAFSIWNPWTESEREGISRTVDYLYQLFLQQVARTRPLDAAEVDLVGRGRVWTGLDAKEAKLVDHIGGLSDAIRRAEELAGIPAGQAVYVDRTGMGGRQLSPGIATHMRSFFHRLGVGTTHPIATPTGELPQALREMESALIWPLYFQSGDALALFPYSLRLK